MSQELNNPSRDPKRTNQPAKQQGSRNTWLMLGVIAVLLAVCIYLFLSKNKVAQDHYKVIVQRDSVIMDRNQLRGEYDAALTRLDELVSKNTALNLEINDKDGQVSRLRNELKGIMSKSNATAKDLARAKTLINELNSRVRDYEDRVAKLEGENRTLTESNTKLTTERDSTATENVAMKKLGSVLHASNIRMFAIDQRRNGTRERETSKAKKVDLLRVYFDIDENRIAESGPKEIYLRILTPEGALLSNAAYGSGITALYDGSSLKYTTQKEIALVKNQPVKDLILDWHQEGSFSTGNYTIELYNEGYRIGSGSVLLK